MLSTTLRHAWTCSEHYRRVLPASVSEGRFPLARLQELPILTKDQYARDVAALRTSDEPGIVQCTSGTTGRPIHVYRSNTEIAFLREFQAAVQHILEGDRNGPERLILALPNTYHGQVMDLPTGGHVLTTGLFDPVQLAQAARWLTMDHTIPGVARRVTRITGVYQLVQWLTYMLHERGFDFSRCSVEQVYLSGGYVTSRWLEVLRRSWDALLIPVYSLTEVFTHANQCVECGTYHFLPNVIAELVDPVDHGPLAGDVGELLLTGLFPFVQGQPVIRYATRDLFRLERGGCAQGDGYRFVGRVDSSWILPVPGEAPVVIGSAEVLDALDSLGELARVSALSGLPGLQGGDEIGRPRSAVRLETGEGATARLSVTAQLRFSPILYPDSAERCRRALERDLLRRLGGLADAVRRALLDLVVRCVGPSEASEALASPWERTSGGGQGLEGAAAQ